jgi:transposase InsO family protein
VESEEERNLMERIRQLAYQHKRYGCQRIRIMLRREGWKVNKKRVHRIWKEEDLQVPRRKRKRRWLGVKGEVVPKAVHRNHVWTYDFIEDRTETGSGLRILAVLDEYTRECLAIEVARSFDSLKVIRCMGWLFLTKGVPEYIRSDNGPEFVANAVREWLGKSGSNTLYIEPGSPWENGYMESFLGKFRDECLNMEVFGNVQEAQIVVEGWRQEYNERRPHSALGGLTPMEFATRSVSFVSPTATLRLQNAGLEVVSSN